MSRLIEQASIGLRTHIPFQADSKRYRMSREAFERIGAADILHQKLEELRKAGDKTAFLTHNLLNDSPVYPDFSDTLRWDAQVKREEFTQEERAVVYEEIVSKGIIVETSWVGRKSQYPLVAYSSRTSYPPELMSSGLGVRWERISSHPDFEAFAKKYPAEAEIPLQDRIDFAMHIANRVIDPRKRIKSSR